MKRINSHEGCLQRDHEVGFEIRSSGVKTYFGRSIYREVREEYTDDQSTPRNRLLADVLSKTGLVERSGQGVDNIYLDTLSEGKPAPDYTKTDDFCVTLILSSRIEDAAFSQFINAIQDSLPDDAKLTVYDVLTLNTIRQTKSRQSLDKKIVTKLLKAGYIEQRGMTSGTYYILRKDYNGRFRNFLRRPPLQKANTQLYRETG